MTAPSGPGAHSPLYRATRPELPPPQAWVPLLEEAYAANWFTNFGALSKRLEARLTAAFAGPGGCCVVTANGTAAIAAPLIAAGVRGPGLASAFTFRAAVSAIRMAGCEPAPVDVSPNDWVVSPAAGVGSLA